MARSKEKSILDKFTETMKGLADSASQALKTEEPGSVEETSAAYMPFTAEGFVSDLLPVPPFAAAPSPPRKRSAVRKTAKRGTGKAAAKPANKITNESVKKSAPKKRVRKAASKSAGARFKQAKMARRRGAARKSARKQDR